MPRKGSALNRRSEVYWATEAERDAMKAASEAWARSGGFSPGAASRKMSTWLRVAALEKLARDSGPKHGKD